MPPATERQSVTVQIELALLPAGALVMRQVGAEGTTETGEEFSITSNMGNCGLFFECRGRMISLTPEAFAHAAFAALDQAGITGPDAPPVDAQPAATDGDDEPRICDHCRCPEAEAILRYGVGLAGSDGCGGVLLCKVCFFDLDPENYAAIFGE